MASEVGISNLALAHLGDRATVSSIDPPEGSAQASNCATFYPIARDALLEMHAWGFATRRTALAPLAITPPSSWAYAYAVPASLMNVIAIMSPNAGDDYSVSLPSPYSRPDSPNDTAGYGAYTPQPYVLESLDDGSSVIYTNVQDAVMRHTVFIIDTGKFSPLFTTTLTYLLASYLAGPVLKGEVGRNESAALLKVAMAYLGKAATSDANDRRATVAHNVPWQAGR